MTVRIPLKKIAGAAAAALTPETPGAWRFITS